jgi:hypothetical protein
MVGTMSLPLRICREKKTTDLAFKHKIRKVRSPRPAFVTATNSHATWFKDL